MNLSRNFTLQELIKSENTEQEENEIGYQQQSKLRSNRKTKSLL